MSTSLRCCAAGLAAVMMFGPGYSYKAVAQDKPFMTQQELKKYERRPYCFNLSDSFFNSSWIDPFQRELEEERRRRDEQDVARRGLSDVLPPRICKLQPVFNFAMAPLNVGASLGGTLVSGPSVNSSSGFYQGGTDSFVGPYVNIFANVPLTTFGPFVVRAGGMIETMHGTFDFSGTAGGVPTTSSGALWQTDFLATLPFITPITPKLLFAVTPVAGFGWLTPTGNPGGPFFTGNDFAGVVGFDLSLLQPVTPNVVVMYNVGYRYTAPTSFNTTLPGELYKIGASNRFMFSASAFWVQGIKIEPNFRW